MRVKKELIKLLKEYISLLERVNMEQSKALYFFGHKSNQKDIDEGLVLREQIRLLETE
ncbi:hypothetical protein M0R04_13915 [Candidatus Dojkabacteria bacterium]|jgi:hypothetical protein|nr:hypothetical protein [Candidatus Dojkabacteria bacterium]